MRLINRRQINTKLAISVALISIGMSAYAIYLFAFNGEADSAANYSPPIQAGAELPSELLMHVRESIEGEFLLKIESMKSCCASEFSVPAEMQDRPLVIVYHDRSEPSVIGGGSPTAVLSLKFSESGFQYSSFVGAHGLYLIDQRGRTVARIKESISPDDIADLVREDVMRP